MNKSSDLIQNFKISMDFSQMTWEQIAERLGYNIKDLQAQARRWSLGSIEKDAVIEIERLKEIIKRVAAIRRDDSKDRVKKANQLHYMMFGEPATDMPTESKHVEANEPAESEKPKKSPPTPTVLKELKKNLDKTDFAFIESFIEWLASAAPIAIIVFAAASFIATGVFNAVFYGYYVGIGAGCFLAIVQDGARFALFLASAKMFKTGKTVLGVVSATVSSAIVFFEIYESYDVAQVWNKAEVAQVAMSYSFIVILGFALELVMALIIHPFKQK